MRFSFSGGIPFLPFRNFTGQDRGFPYDTFKGKRYSLHVCLTVFVLQAEHKDMDHLILTSKVSKQLTKVKVTGFKVNVIKIKVKVHSSR